MPGRINYTSGTLNKAKKVRRGTIQQLPRKPLFAAPRLTEEELEAITEASLSEAGAPKLSAFGEDEEEKTKIKWNYSYARADGRKKERGRRKSWFLDFEEKVLARRMFGDKTTKKRNGAKINQVERFKPVWKNKLAILNFNLSGLPKKPPHGRGSRKHPYLESNAHPYGNAVTGQTSLAMSKVDHL